MTAPQIATSPVGFDAGAVLARLRTTFESGRTRTLEWRREQLAGLRRMLTEREDELVEALRADLGRPTVEAFGADIGHCKAEVRHLHARVDRWMRPTKVGVPLVVAPARAEVRSEPLGVALVIAPWNYPLQLLLEPMAAALAAGNCVVGKPSEVSAACASALARLVPRYLDPDAVTIVEGGVPEAKALLSQPWDHVFFTGSTAVGRVVAEAAARHLTPVTLELGGKSPVYVAADADLEIAARRIAWGKFLNAGQTCVAPDYVLADRAVRDRLVDRLVDQVRRFYGPDPRASTSYGRIINERHLARLADLLAGGAGRVVLGGDADPAGRYLAPTITVDPDHDGPLMSEEIFGPILPVVAVDGTDDAIAFITSRPKPLALYVFAGSEVVDAVLARTSSGGVCVNHTVLHLVPPDLPFGGVGASGHGAYHGKAGFDTFSHAKSVLRKPRRPDPRLLYPPYTGIAERLLRRVLR
jgi:aldehyde dehydrogenase (NAD+)